MSSPASTLPPLDTVITGGTAVLPWGETLLNIGITDGRIAYLGSEHPKAAQHLNAKGLHILPGCIDAQVHFREPGLTHKEDLESGTRGAVLGGITTVLEMPNTNPSTTDAAAMADKVHRAQQTAWCNTQFFVGVTPHNASQLETLERLPGCCGGKIFMGSSTGSLLVDDAKALEAAFASGHRRICVHAEDEARLKERYSLAATEGHPRAHPLWRDEQTGLIATQQAVALAEKYRRPVHVLHVTTAEEAAFLAQHKRWATMEVLPQHLTLSAPECYERLGTLAQMNPPIREKRHQEALWQAVQTGVVNVIASDHAPHTLDEKAKPYPQSPSGLTGVQTLLPIMLNHVHAGRLSLSHLVTLLCSNPAKLFELPGKGAIALGMDADLTLVDLKTTREISNQWIASKVGWTPYDGLSITGWPIMTLINGTVVMQNDTLIQRPTVTSLH
ncbi:MAG: dihydroorotase [Vampirovibrionales bacterium]